MLVRKQNGADTHRTNILEIIGNASVGGMERYVHNLIHQLPTDQFRVTCLCPYESAFTVSLRQLGCSVFIAPIHDDPPWRSIQLAVEVIRHHQIDLIHAHMPKAHVLAGLAGCLTQTPVVATVHGMNITTHELGICRTTGSSLITVCQEAYTQALAMGVPPERLALIPNGVDTNAFVPGRSGKHFREAIGVPLDVPLVGFVGRLSQEKGPDLFVRAADRVARTRPDVHFVIVGEGQMENALADMIEHMGLGDRLHLVGLWEDTSEVYPALDVVALTSRSEGMPLTLLEAMACGRPTVAIGVGGVPEIVEVGTTGLLVGAHDWDGVGRSVLELLARPARMQRMGQAARRRVEELFDLRTSARLTADLFGQLVGGHPRQRSLWRTWPAVHRSR